MYILWYIVLLSVGSAVKDVHGQLMGPRRPETSFGFASRDQCPKGRGLEWSCVPESSCGALLPKNSRRLCGGDGTEPFICCPQQPTPQPAVPKQQPTPQPAVPKQQPTPQPPVPKQQPTPQPPVPKQQPTPQPPAPKGYGTYYGAHMEGSYIPDEPISGAAVGRIRLRRAISYPWMVAIGELQNDGSVDWLCDGALIQADTVLTAAHCVYYRSVYYVRVGEEGASPEDIEVDTGYRHPNYTLTEPYNDIAILKLSEPAEYSPYVSPVSLPEPDQTVDYEGRNAVLTGWDYGDEGGPVLREVNVTIFNNSECKRAYTSSRTARRNYPEGIISSQLCAGDRSGSEDAWQDNPGGLLLVREGGVDILVGVLSSDIGCGPKDFLGVYTNVSPYVDQIKYHLR